MTEEREKLINLDRPKPHDEEAELNVISIIARQNRMIETYNLKDVGIKYCMSLITASDFYNPLLGVIFNSIRSLMQQYSQVTLNNILQDIHEDYSLLNIYKNLDKEIDIIKHKIEETKCNEDELLKSVYSIRRYAKIRKIISTCTEAIQRCYNEQAPSIITDFIKDNI